MRLIKLVIMYSAGASAWNIRSIEFSSRSSRCSRQEEQDLQ